MNIDPQSVSCLSLAAAAGIGFLLLNKIWVWLFSLARPTMGLDGQLQQAPTDYWRRRLHHFESRVNTHAAAMVVSGFVFLTLYFTVTRPWWRQLASWQWIALGLFFIGLLTYECHKIMGLFLARQRAARRLDTRIATTQSLMDVSTRGNHLFHAIMVGDRIIDHIVVGTNGIYVIHVKVRAPSDTGVVTLQDNMLLFDTGLPPTGLDHWDETLKLFAARVNNVLGHTVRVMSVVAIPGWRIGDHDSECHLLVNDRTMAVLTGWKHADANLMDSEVIQVKQLIESMAAKSRCVVNKMRPRRLPKTATAKSGGN